MQGNTKNTSRKDTFRRSLHHLLNTECNLSLITSRPGIEKTMASTRLRKTFHYPSSDSEPDDLDEEHQDALLTSLKTQDDAKNALYRKLYLVIPLSAATYFFLTLFTAASARQRLIALLSLSSLLCTAYILHFMPLQTPDTKGKRAVYQVQSLSSPIEQYLPYLNAALAGLMLLSAGGSWRRGAVDDAWKEALPASKLR
jgi:hypothetical protein